jgi:hypothetical protein
MVKLWACAVVAGAGLAAAQSPAPTPRTMAPPSAPPPAAKAPAPPGAGERLTMRVTYAKLLAGRAFVSVDAQEHLGHPLLRLTLLVKSEGFFAWLFRYKVDDYTVALWDPASGCSYGIEKHLREGRAVRDQRVTIDPLSGAAQVDDRKVAQKAFQLGPCPLDVFSAFFVARQRGLGKDGRLTVRVFDNGKLYDLPFKLLGHEYLDLPPPLGKRVLTQVAEPVIPPGSGLFAQEGRLVVWATADERRIPVRLRSKVAVGSVSADLEAYTPPFAPPVAR